LVDTEFVKQIDQAWRDEQAAQTPLKRLAEPKEIGQAAVAIATSFPFTTGTIFSVDGGRPLQ
jgi:3-oxoacyl-[acyl-carrier protein] reductase